MGVNLEVRAHTTAVLTDVEILALSYRMVEANGHDLFWMDREKRRHAFTRVDDDYYDYPRLSSGTTLKINTFSRYYGPGYERGNFAAFYMLMTWLEGNLEGPTLWYGGDSDGSLENWNDIKDEYLKHWLKVGHQPYRGYPGSQGSSMRTSLVIPTCDLCKVQMIRNGWGGGGNTEFAAVWCPCGVSQTTHDGGATWQMSKEL